MSIPWSVCRRGWKPCRARRPWCLVRPLSLEGPWPSRRPWCLPWLMHARDWVRRYLVRSKVCYMIGGNHINRFNIIFDFRIECI